MPQHESSIFRQEAVRHCYGSEQPVLSRFVSSKAFIGLWILTAMLFAGAIARWSTPVRTQVSGAAVAIDGRTVVAFLPADSRSHLSIGQSLHLSSAEGGGQTCNKSIVSIDPDVVSPEGARRRYGLDSSMAKAITNPAVITIARCESPAGRVYRVTVEGQTRPLFSFFKMLGRVEARP